MCVYVCVRACMHVCVCVHACVWVCVGVGVGGCMSMRIFACISFIIHLLSGM